MARYQLLNNNNNANFLLFINQMLDNNTMRLADISLTDQPGIDRTYVADQF